MLAGVGSAFAQEVDEIIVRGVNIPDEKRATSEISAVLDEASFQRTGDSEIGDALRRVTGLSLSQGRFPIVRGLNERYSTVTINGSPLPSPEPLRRVVPLDIIPTAILSGSLVQKTYSPEFSAEFGGGLIDLRTKTVPSDPFLSITTSVGVDTATSARNGLLYDGGERDWTGFDDGTRNIPDALGAVFVSGDINATNQQAIDVGLETQNTTVVSENLVPVNTSVGIAFGGGKDLTDRIRLGGTFTLGYTNDWQTRNGRREQGFSISADPEVDQNLESTSFDFTSTTNTIDTNAVASIGLELGDNHKFTSTSFILRSSLKDARLQEGTQGQTEDDLFINRFNTEFFERQVWQSQLRGEHVFPALGDLEVVWRGAYGEAFRDAPYQWEYTYVQEINTPNAPFRADFQAGGQTSSTPFNVSFSKLEDQNIDAGIDFKLPLNLFERDLTVKFGYAFTDKERDVLVRRFELVGSGLNNIALQSDLNAVLESRVDVLLSPAVLETDLINLQLLQSGIDLDNAFSSLQVHAGYVGVDVEINPYLRLAAGGRYETSEQVTTAFSTTSPISSLSQTSINEDYFLPAATLTWNPVGDFQLRVGYSRTIARPQFRELTPAFYLDDDTDLEFRGNPFLQNTRVNNYDARAEYYLGRGQFITLGAFYKELTNPIEEVFDIDQGGEFVISFINAPSAELYGFEFEFEQNFELDRVIGNERFVGTDLILKANYTWSESNVSIFGSCSDPDPVLGCPVSLAGVNSSTGAQEIQQFAGALFQDGRSLQGQSNNLFNFQVGVENQERNERLTLLVNYASNRIRNVEGVFSGVAVPRVIERPPVSLDVVYSRGFRKFGGDWEIGLKARNLLGEDYDATQVFPDGTVALFDTYQLGRELSVSLSRTF